MKAFTLKIDGKFTRNSSDLKLRAWETGFDGLVITEEEWGNGFALTHVATGLKATHPFETREDALKAAKIIGPLINWSVSDEAEILSQIAKLSTKQAAAFISARGGKWSGSVAAWKKECAKSASISADLARRKLQS